MKILKTLSAILVALVVLVVARVYYINVVKPGDQTATVVVHNYPGGAISALYYEADVLTQSSNLDDIRDVLHNDDVARYVVVWSKMGDRHQMFFPRGQNASDALVYLQPIEEEVEDVIPPRKEISARSEKEE